MRICHLFPRYSTGVSWDFGQLAFKNVKIVSAQGHGALIINTKQRYRQALGPTQAGATPHLRTMTVPLLTQSVA
jgi:hypothetical protein